jgi:hypothetical protein
MNEEYISSKGHTWTEVRETLLTPEERAASHLRVAMMIELTSQLKTDGHKDIT